MEDVKSVIVRAREILSDPKHWIKSTYARNLVGDSVLATSPHAVCWCSMGALWKAFDEVGKNTTRMEAYTFLQKNLLENEDIAGFNDNPDTTHSDVMAAFDRAIESLEG